MIYDVYLLCEFYLLSLKYSSLFHKKEKMYLAGIKYQILSSLNNVTEFKK